MPSKRKTMKRKSRKCKKRVKKNMICFSSKNKKMTKKMKRIGKRLLKTKGIKLSRCSKKRLTSAKKPKSKKLKKKKRKKRSRNAKGTRPIFNIDDIGHIDDMNLATPNNLESPATAVVQNNIEFPTFSDDGNDITINIDGNQETVKENKGLNFYELVDYLNNADDGDSLTINRYMYNNGNVYKTEVNLGYYDQNNDFMTVIDSYDGGQYYIQPEDFICNYREENESFCYTHGHARDMPNKNVDVYEIPQN